MSDHSRNASPVASTSVVECAECLEGDSVRSTLEKFQQAINAGQPVVLQAAGVRRVSTLALQMIAAARATARRHGQSFSVLTPSPEFERACADTGLRSLLSSGD